MATNRRFWRGNLVCVVVFPICLAALGALGCKKARKVEVAAQPAPGPIVAAHQSVAPSAPKPPPLRKHADEIKAQEDAEKEAIRDADFEDLMAAILAKRLGGLAAVKEACSDAGRDEPVEIEKAVFGDLDGDGKDEAAVTAFSCQAGQSGPEMFAVFKRQEPGDIVEWKLEETRASAKFRGSKVVHDLRGPWSVDIAEGRLVVRYLSWAPDAPKCGDADCTTDFVYRWDGKKLALTDITQSPVR